VLKFPAHLLEQAGMLAGMDKGKPRQASLRRAVSTAYYSIFHLLTMLAVTNWKKSRQRPQLARAFEHKRMNSACKKIKKAQFQKVSANTVKHLQSIATVFIQLQEARHRADYDNAKKWTRTEVLTLIESARSAFDSWEIICREPCADDFLLQLLIHRE
jgi:uncharacterized protein (UPF0332 family)